MAKIAVDSSVLIELLRARHSQDVFVTECKTGPTQTADKCPRLDAWAMNRSWANARVTGYEVKVSRSDFLRDAKWHQYLAYCNDFYFVCPQGILDVSEIPADAGLIEASKNNRRLLLRKKSPVRSIEIPESIFRYILMSRASIKKESYFHKDARYWRDWLEERQRNKEVGHDVAQHLSKVAREIHWESETIKRESERIKSEFADVRRVLEELGITSSTWRVGHDVRDRIKLIQKIQGSDFMKTLRTIESSLDEFRPLLRIPGLAEEGNG